MTHAALLLAAAVFSMCAGVAIANAVAKRHALTLRFTSIASVFALVIGVALAVLASPREGGGVAFLACDLAVAAVAVSALTDAQTGYIFDAVTLPALIAAVGIAMLNGTLVGTAAGMCAGAGALFALYVATFGKGLGLGDVKLAACIGSALGPKEGLTVLAIAFVLGGAFAAYLLVTRRGRFGDVIGFAPYMGAATGLVLLYRSFV